jgi:inner membrane protein YidH
MSDAPNSDPRVDFAHDRTTLAKLRTSLALDRTTLAWIRTNLTMGTFGLGMIGFFRTLSERAQTAEAERLHQAAIRFGELLVLMGIVASMLAGASHWNALRRMKRGELLNASRWPLSIRVALCVAVLGAVALWRMRP